MNVKKHLWSLVPVILPGLGFALMCIGIYLMSLKTEKYTWRVIPACTMIALGLLAMLIGVFWTMFYHMKSKMYNRRCNRAENVDIYTVERPATFPPSYEESQQSQICTAAGFAVVINGVDMVMSLAPPLYSQDNSDTPDCTWSWEQPPRYSQVECLQQGQVNSDEQREAMPVD